MFRNEDLFRTLKLSGEQIKEKRLKLTRPILERIHHKVVMMMQDTKLMANELMRKAVNYTINQWKSLKNILKDGSAEISNIPAIISLLTLFFIEDLFSSIIYPPFFSYCCF